MALNPFFLQGSQSEQRLVQEVIVAFFAESISFREAITARYCKLFTVC